MNATVFDDRRCTLGEGPLWHPARGQLFWFDITGKRLLSREGERQLHWDFPENVSAAGWVDDDRLLIASESSLSVFDIGTGLSQPLVALEADNPLTRSNDGRADPLGGFWIGTMSKRAERKAGAIYRYWRGELRKLFDGISIPNAICFAPDGETAFFADSVTRRVMRQRLGRDGWPLGDPEVYLDLLASGLIPDGAVIDGAGLFWNAHWGSGKVCAYAPDGSLRAQFQTNAPNLTCPAFGGDDMATLYLTSATEDMKPGTLEAHPDAGKTLCLHGVATGRPEHRVIL
ncbi:SMP-30/gluconolactonase/LRE family protein [Actibacterium sp. MT2.3-13A]|uniref:SMP-30/gluconolactonase/LRE family protein n=1 Tax=Actibacterium sp. MT2.3-13A TaxID=2828332 RepID=UPI001BAABB37|nr:SMP-30/gluconolactonase/LRE family protein [Actibacterium sp. MT2.3-13A]